MDTFEKLWSEVTHIMFCGSFEGFIQYAPSHMRSVLFGYNISLRYCFALKVLRGHDFLAH